MPETRQFYATLLKLAIPVTIQNVVMSSLNLVDTIMIGQLGAIEVAAVGQANRYFFILILILFAFGSGTAIFTAQYWGKKDTPYIGIIMAIALIPSLSFAILFTIGGIFLPKQIMSAFTTDPAVIADGCVYLRIVVWSYVFTAIPILYTFVLRSMEQVTLPMYSSVAALSVNTFLNYCLIFGHFGFPELGVKGAAIATLIARVFETLLIMGSTYWKRYPAARFDDFLKISPGLVRQFTRTILPVLINEVAWVLGMTVYAFVYGRMGTPEVAAVNIVNPVEQLCVSAFFGMASAASIMIGNQIGAKQDETAFTYAKRFAYMTPLGALVFGGLLILGAPSLLGIFNVTEEVRTLAVKTLWVLGAVLSIKMFNMMNIVGILRGGGDTKYSMYLEMLAIWVIGVPLALLGGLVWKFSVYRVFALVQCEECFKMLVGLFRLSSKKWIHNLTE